LTTLRGKLVLLRAIALDDIDEGWLEWINSPTVNNTLASSRPVTRDDLIAYYRASQPPSAHMFAICELNTGRYVGNGRISSVDADNKKATYGWFIGRPSDRRSGYGTDALDLLVRFAFDHLRLNRVSTSVRVDNVASLKANERVGFKREGILREYVLKNGRYYDAVQLSLLRREYELMRAPDGAEIANPN